MKTRGFTLVELVVVIVLMGIVGMSLAIFLKPAITSYLDTHRRAELTDIADTALRRMGQEIRGAVPNSVRAISATCIQIVPTITGGRYRKDIDPDNPGEAVLDTSAATTQFDVLSPMTTIPAVGDWVVINNQNGNDVYAGTNRSNITAAVTTPTAANGLHRITISSTQFSPGYDGGRFTVVPNATQTIFYNLVGTTLYRTTAAFGANTAATCASTAGAILATGVTQMVFDYTPNQGATQQSGFVWMRIQLTSQSDVVGFAYGVHVSNVP